MVAMPNPRTKGTKALPISKQTVDTLEDASIPEPEPITQIRTGKPQRLGNERSAIFKQIRQGPVKVTPTGLGEDEHITNVHGGIHRAIHQYAATHYPTWRREQPERMDEFQIGAFGENLTARGLTEENVCVGDIFAIGDHVRLQVTEPRMPCYKLNMRFQNPKMLSSVLKTGRSGWLFRVLQTGEIQAGDEMKLLERQNPQWSIRNVMRVVHGKYVKTDLLEELADLSTLSPYHHDLVIRKLEKATRTYVLTNAEMISKRVRLLTFTLKDKSNIRDPSFRPFAFAQVTFGPKNGRISRSYSIVSGNLQQFDLGVALDDHSRGGSKYLHDTMRIGDEIQMAPGTNPSEEEEEEKCKKEDIRRNIVIIGGIGVTAFLPTIKSWERDGTEFDIHYAVRSLEDAAFVDRLPKDRTIVYAKSRNERLNVEKIIPINPGHTRLFICGPEKLISACEQRAQKLQYPEHLLHIESFGSASSGPLGSPFEVEVEDVDSGEGPKTLTVPEDKSLLNVLRDAGFDVMSSCEAGTCGTCKVKLCDGDVVRKGKALAEEDKERCILSCVDRGKARIRIEFE